MYAVFFPFATLIKAYTKLCSDIAICALSPSPLTNWERGADRRGEGSTIFDCNLVLITTKILSG
jgi:hypothetical protein